MSGTVTVPGPSGSTVTIPFTSSQIASMAQTAGDTALTLLNQPSVPGIGPLFEIIGYSGSGVLQSPALLGQLDITGSTAASFGIMPTGYLSVDDSSSAQQVMLNTMTQPTTVTSGTGGIVYGNLSSNNTVFLAGGVNLIAEFSSTAFSTIYVDAATNNYNNNANAATDVYAFSGSTSVIGVGGSAIEVFAGTGSNSVSVGAGTDFVGVSNAHTVPGTTTAVTVTATSGLLNFQDAGAPAVIVGDASNVVVLSGGSGAVTLFGGTGSDTVFGGPSGVFNAGTGGNSILQTSTVASVAAATTLVGGASGDVLVANGSGASLVAGAGGESLFTTSATVGGTTFKVGTASESASDTITGSFLGGDTVGLNTGTANITFLGIGSVDHVSIAAGGGSDTINNFRVGTDVFSLGGASVTSDVFASNNTTVTLSDGTHLTFVGVNMQTSNFS
jgi:hypothetical protein